MWLERVPADAESPGVARCSVPELLISAYVGKHVALSLCLWRILLSSFLFRQRADVTLRRETGGEATPEGYLSSPNL